MNIIPHILPYTNMLNDHYCQDFYSSGFIGLNPSDPEGATLITLRGWNELGTPEKRTRRMLQLKQNML